MQDHLKEEVVEEEEEEVEDTKINRGPVAKQERGLYLLPTTNDLLVIRPNWALGRSKFGMLRAIKLAVQVALAK